MKNLLFPLLDKLLLRKSSIIETLFAKLKPGMGLEHSRHRSPLNAFAQILSSLAQPRVNIGTATIPLISPDLIQNWGYNRNPHHSRSMSCPCWNQGGYPYLRRVCPSLRCHCD